MSQRISTSEAMLETLQLLEEDPQIASKLRQAEKEIKSGEYQVWKPKTSQVAEKTRAYKTKKKG